MRTPAPLSTPMISGLPLVDVELWRSWFSSFTDYYGSVLRWTDPNHKEFGKVEPPTKIRKEGLIAYADNVNWKPASAAGYYYWTGSIWKFVS